MRITTLILYVTLCINASHSSGLRVSWRLGSELARALADPSVSVAELDADVVLQDSDFFGFNLPILVERDLVIQGSSGQQQPVLDFNYTANKVQLANGVTLAFCNLTTLHARAKTFSVAPGVDLLVSTLPGVKATVIFDGGTHISELCYPQNVQLYAKRPEELPGEQLVFRGLPQPGCTNSSAAPLIERCWARKVRWDDLALAAYDLAVREAPVDGAAYEVEDPIKAFTRSQIFTNYNLWLRNQSALCLMEINSECIRSLGVMGCVWQTAATLPPAKPTVPPVATPGGAALGGSGGSKQPTGSRGPGQGGSPPRREEHPKSVVLPVVVGAVGGAAALAAVSVVIALLMMRQRRRKQQPQGAASEMSLFSKHPEGGASAPEAAAGGCSKVEAGKGETMDSDDNLETAPNGLEGPRAVHRGDDPTAGEPDDRASRHAVLSPLTPLRRDVNLSVRLLPLLSDGGAQQLLLQQGVQQHRLQPQITFDSSLACDVRGHIAGGNSVSMRGNDAGSIQQPSPNDSPGLVVSANPNDSPSAQEELRLLNVVLGRGGSGKVIVGEYRGGLVAVKVLHLPGTVYEPLTAAKDDQQAEDTQSSNVECAPHITDTRAKYSVWDQAREQRVSELMAQAFRQEVEILGRCQHPNVVRLLAACAAPPRLCLVMELAETNLAKLLHGSGNFVVRQDATSPNLLPLPVVLHIAIDIARGLEYLHPTIMHRDLKPANVLINRADSERPMAKLADFGLSRLRNTVQATANPEVGTPPYMAPECFDLLNFVVTHHVDIYSWAVLMYEMLSGQMPWCGVSSSEIAFNVALKGRRPPLSKVPPERCHRKLARLITQCWDQIPMRRPAAAEVVKQLLLIQQGL